MSAQVKMCKFKNKQFSGKLFIVQNQRVIIYGV